MDAVGIDVKLESWSKELDTPKADLQKQLDEIAKTKCNGDYDAAIKKLQVALKRNIRRLKDMVDFKGIILAKSQPRNVAQYIENRGEELYVANMLGVLNDTNQLWKMTLWGKDAERNDIPECVDIDFKAIKRAESARCLVLGGTDIEFTTTSDKERKLTEFSEQLKPYTTTLAGLEDHYTAKVEVDGDNVVVISGIVFDKFNRPTKKGNYIITLDEIDSELGSEELLTTVAVPERKMVEIEPGDEVTIIGDCWKPKQTYDRATRGYIDVPGRVQINAWAIEKLGGNVIRLSV